RPAGGGVKGEQVEAGSLNIAKSSGVRNATTGLVPDFVVSTTPEPSTTGPGDEGLCYKCFDYNACRVPLREARAAAHYGVAGASDVADKMVAWMRGHWNNAPASMTAGYQLNGA